MSRASKMLTATMLPITMEHIKICCKAIVENPDNPDLSNNTDGLSDREYLLSSGSLVIAMLMQLLKGQGISAKEIAEYITNKLNKTSHITAMTEGLYNDRSSKD